MEPALIDLVMLGTILSILLLRKQQLGFYKQCLKLVSSHTPS